VARQASQEAIWEAFIFGASGLVWRGRAGELEARGSPGEEGAAVEKKS